VQQVLQQQLAQDGRHGLLLRVVILAVEIEDGGLRVELFRLLNDEGREDGFS
jgi:hypothetical protein